VAEAEGLAERIRLDLNSPEFQDVFFRPEVEGLEQVVQPLRRPDHDSAYRR
jgi:hypothetical protein